MSIIKKRSRMLMLMVVVFVFSIFFKMNIVNAAGKKIVNSLLVDKNALVMDGDEAFVDYKVNTSNGASKKIEVQSQNESIASVKVKKKRICIIGNKVGTTNVIVKTVGKNKKGKKIQKKIKVKVYPAYLADKELFNADGNKIGRTVCYDRLKNRYDNAFVMAKLGSQGTYGARDKYEWYINGKYNKVKGVISFSNEDNYVEGYIGRLKIYADDILVYTSPDINYKSGPIPFDIDITGAKFLRFEHDEVCEILIDSCIVYK